MLVDSSLYGESYTGEIRTLLSGQAGVRREIHLHGYHRPYLPEAFELSASLRPPS